MLCVIKSIFIWAGVGLLTLTVIPFALLPLALIAARCTHARRLFYTITSWLCRCILAMVGLKIQIYGNRALIQQEPGIIIMNHTSSLDIPLLEALMAGAPFVWLSKASYLKIPIAGTILHRMHVAVDRQHAAQAAKSLAVFAEKATRFNAHMLMFPEGTRYTDGALHAFKAGFAVAQELTQRSVVPIMVQGLHTILPKHGLVIDSSEKTIKIIIGTPLQRDSNESREAFVQRVHSTCTSMLSKAL
jgi:1-acyl-sn-glycerol-3-phosphate acyltransferase